MPLLLPSIAANSQRLGSHKPFLLLQSSVAQSCLQVLRGIINHESRKTATEQTQILLLCFLHPLSSLLNETTHSDQIEVYDYTVKVPGYDNSWTDPQEEILLAVKAGEYVDHF